MIMDIFRDIFSDGVQYLLTTQKDRKDPESCQYRATERFIGTTGVKQSLGAWYNTHMCQ